LPDNTSNFQLRKTIILSKEILPSSSAKISVICLSGSLACAVTRASLEHFLPNCLAAEKMTQEENSQKDF